MANLAPTKTSPAGSSSLPMLDRTCNFGQEKVIWLKLYEQRQQIERHDLVLPSCGKNAPSTVGQLPDAWSLFGYNE